MILASSELGYTGAACPITDSVPYQGELFMAGLVAVKAGGTDVLIAVRRNPNDVSPVTNIDEKINQAADTLQSKFEVIRGIAEDLAGSLRSSSSQIKEAELEFGLSLSGKGNLYVVETTVEATFKVTLKMEFTPATGGKTP
jgi:Trypsin-co-occurring domain 1